MEGTLTHSTYKIDSHIAKGWGVRAAAIFGWIFEHCQQQLPQKRGVQYAHPYVKVSEEELGRVLHMTRHTVGRLLKQLVSSGLVGIKSPKGQDRTRCYTIAPGGFTAMGLWAGEWHFGGEEALVCWGLNEAISSKVGVSAAVVFQYLWFWLHNWRWSSHCAKGGHVWLPYTASSLARWIPFMSDDVILDALHRLEREGFIVRQRKGCCDLWAIADAGFEAMGEEALVSFALALCSKTITPQQEEARLKSVKQKISVQLAHWRLEKRRGYKRRTQHNLR